VRVLIPGSASSVVTPPEVCISTSIEPPVFSSLGNVIPASMKTVIPVLKLVVEANYV